MGLVGSIGLIWYARAAAFRSRLAPFIIQRMASLAAFIRSTPSGSAFQKALALASAPCSAAPTTLPTPSDSTIHGSVTSDRAMSPKKLPVTAKFITMSSRMRSRASVELRSP